MIERDLDKFIMDGVQLNIVDREARASLDSKVDESELDDYLKKTDASTTYATKTELENSEITTKAATLAEVAEIYATKTELNGKADASELSNYLKTSDASTTYATKTELGTKADTSDLANYATKSTVNSIGTVTFLGNVTDSQALSLNLTNYKYIMVSTFYYNGGRMDNFIIPKAVLTDTKQIRSVSVYLNTSNSLFVDYSISTSEISMTTPVSAGAFGWSYTGVYGIK